MRTFGFRPTGLLLFALVLTSCPKAQTLAPVSESGAARLGDPLAEPSEASAAEAEAGTDNGAGTDAGPEDLITELGLGRKVPLETPPMTEFFNALDATSTPKAQRTVRILHYGDSHSAADVLTTAIRRALQTRFGDGGRGFVYLGKPWRSYRPLDIETHAQGGWIPQRFFAAKDPARMDGWYGLGGVAVDAPQKGGVTTVATSRGSAFGDKASGFEIFYLMQPGGGRFDIHIDGRKKTTIDTASLALQTGFYQTTLKEGRHTLEIRTAKNQQVRLFGAVVERRGPGVVLDTLGINGAFFDTPLRWDETLLSEQIAQRSPDLLITMYGANDVDIRNLSPAAYTDKVRQVMSRFLSAAPEASCLMLGPMDRKGPKNNEDGGARLDLIIEAQRQVSEELDCAFMDLRDLMGGNGARYRWLEKGLAQKDGVHLTISGYRILGELIVERLMDAYDRYRLEELNGKTALNDRSSAEK